MREKTIGNYLCEDAADGGFYLLHTVRKEYITDARKRWIEFKDAGRYSAVSGSFVAELPTGGYMLIDDNGICLDQVFDEIGYECGTMRPHRPVKFSGSNNVWTYCVRKENKTELMYENLCSGIKDEDEDVRLGDKLGDGIYYCLEHYPKQGEPYKTIGFAGKEIPNFRFSSFQVKPGKLECIVGKELGGKTIVFGPHYLRAHVAPFNRLLSWSPDGKYWVGVINEEPVIYDFYKKKIYKKEPFDAYGLITYDQALNVFLLHTMTSVPRVYDIWDMEWQAAGIRDYKMWKKIRQKSRNTFRVVDYLGQSYDITLQELVARQRELLDSVEKANDKVRYSQANMTKALNKKLDEMGYNDLRNFCKTTPFKDWPAYFYRIPIKYHSVDLKTLILATQRTKMETSALVLVESENEDKLFVCQRLKEDIDSHVFYLMVLFEITDFPKTVFKDIQSGAKIKVADLFKEGHGSLLEKLTGKKKAPKTEESKQSILIPLMQQLQQRDKDKTFPPTEVEFDDSKYTLIPYQPWETDRNPFETQAFLPKSSGVFVLINDSFVSEPMRAMATTEGAFSVMPDYMMEGVGLDGQYISKGNANGHIILKRKDVYLFYRDGEGTLRFFDHAVYWGHTEHSVSTRPILHIYLKSLLRKKC